jgi:hypothetical protein
MLFDLAHAQRTRTASYGSSRPGSVQRPVSLNGARGANAISRECWRKAVVHAQQHLVVDKHELELESVGD